MPWKESQSSDERLKFIAQVLSGDSTMTDLCRRFGVSRKTGYKWKSRYEVGGPAALVDLSRRPHSHFHAIPESTRERLIEMRQKHPTWGARKIRARLLRLEPNGSWPSASTIHRAIAAGGLVRVARKRRTVLYVQPLIEPTRPNQVWCMDFKGSFECGNGERCDTFTVTDAFSRFVLYCQVIDSLSHEAVDRVCDDLMKQFGVPERIRTDNGTPFSSISGLGISKLSVKWMQLGIVHERIEPGKPTQNGRHERLHRTLKEDTASPPAPSLAEQRERFAAFQYCFNEQRPHQALLMQTPISLYNPIIRRLPHQVTEIRYDERYIVRPVRKNGTIRWKSREVFITEVLRRERIGLLPVANGAFQVYFGQMYLGILESETSTFNPNRQCLPQSQAHEQQPVFG